MFDVAVVTLFPEMLNAIEDYGVTGRAVNKGLVRISTFNPRDYAHGTHKSVDDRPYGGGPGMVMRIKPLQDAIHAAKIHLPGAMVIYLSPQGRRLDQQAVAGLAINEKLILVSGRYEGVDERLIFNEIDEEWSIGDYVLSGGELAAMVLIDVLARTVPGVLGHDDSANEDSFVNGLLDYPHYTRPEDFNGDRVPDVLMSGDHNQIKRWRMKQALGRTWIKRPDLLESVTLNDEQKELLVEYQNEFQTK